jgi:hypothetical protein
MRNHMLILRHEAPPHGIRRNYTSTDKRCWIGR